MNAIFWLVCACCHNLGNARAQVDDFAAYHNLNGDRARSNKMKCVYDRNDLLSMESMSCLDRLDDDIALSAADSWNCNNYTAVAFSCLDSPFNQD